MTMMKTSKPKEDNEIIDIDPASEYEKVGEKDDKS